MRPESEVLAGRPFPLGAHAEAGGVRFAVTSHVADAVEVCLVDDDGAEKRVELTERTFGVWHGLVPGVTPGQKYGFRVHGPYDAGRGLRIRPYAKRGTMPALRTSSRPQVPSGPP